MTEKFTALTVIHQHTHHTLKTADKRMDHVIKDTDKCLYLKENSGWSVLSKIILDEPNNKNKNQQNTKSTIVLLGLARPLL